MPAPRAAIPIALQEPTTCAFTRRLNEPSTPSMAWRRFGAPKVLGELDGLDIDVGWRYTIERNGEQRQISVVVAGGRLTSPELADECREAIRTKGASAVDAVLDREHPPRIRVITTVGISDHG